MNSQITPKIKPLFVPKKWGYELWIHNDPLYCGKKLVFMSGQQCSLHYHKLKTETFYILSGEVTIIWYPKEWSHYYETKGNLNIPPNYSILGKGDTFHLVPGTIHQIHAKCDSEILEISTEHFDSDSYRIVRND